MRRDAIFVPVALGLALAVAGGAAAAADEPAPDEAARLGEVRGDTVYVDLDRLVTAALERNDMLQASAAMADAAGAEAAGAWQGFLPQVTLSEFFLRSDDPLQAFGYKLNNRNAQPTDFAPDVLNHPGEVNNWVSQIKLLQPIFNGGMGLYGKQAADAASRAAEHRFRRARQTVALQAIQAYEGLALALSYEEVVAAAVRSAEAHVQQAQSMVDAEMATEADLLQARVFLSTLQQQHITVRNQVAAAREGILLLTAVETPHVVTVPERDHVAAAAPARPDTATVARRNDLVAMSEQARAAGKMVGVARGAMLPHVNLSVQKNWFSHDDIFGSDADSWQLGVYATWDIFKGLGNINSLRKAKAESRAAEHQASFERRRARQEALQAWRDAKAAADRLEVARTAVESARESLRIVSNQYREGLASMVDLLDVQAAATRAEGNLVQARHDHNLSLARLAYAAGNPVHEGVVQ